MPFLNDQKDWKEASPPSPKSSDQKFEIANLLNIVQRSNNYGFGDDMILHSSGERVVRGIGRIGIGHIGIGCFNTCFTCHIPALSPSFNKNQCGKTLIV